MSRSSAPASRSPAGSRPFDVVLARVFARALSCAATSKGRSDAIAVTLDDRLHDKRMTLTELAEAVDITLANLSILKTGKARAIRFSTLEALCAALDCQPGDLLAYVSDGDAARATDDVPSCSRQGRKPAATGRGGLPDDKSSRHRAPCTAPVRFAEVVIGHAGSR